MQEVHTRSLRVPPLTRACTGRRLTFQRRLLTLWAWLMLLPDRGPLPHTSQTRAMTAPVASWLFVQNTDFTGAAAVPANGGPVLRWLRRRAASGRTGGTETGIPRRSSSPSASAVCSSHTQWRGTPHPRSGTPPPLDNRSAFSRVESVRLVRTPSILSPLPLLFSTLAVFVIVHQRSQKSKPKLRPRRYAILRGCLPARIPSRWM